MLPLKSTRGCLYNLLRSNFVQMQELTCGCNYEMEANCLLLYKEAEQERRNNEEGNMIEIRTHQNLS